MSSLYGAVDMDNVKMPMDLSGNHSSLSGDRFAGGNSTFPSGDSMGMASLDTTPPSSYGFSDPAILSQLSDMENGIDVKFPLQDGISPAATYSPHQMSQGQGHALPAHTVAPWLNDSKSSMSTDGAGSPPSTHSSGQSPSHGLYQAQSMAPTPAGIDTSGASASMSSVSSPISPSLSHSLAPSSGSGPISTTGIPLSGIVPQRDGSQVTVGAVVASVLDNVVQMASQARDAYLAGKQDLTHVQIEEMLESLKLVGGLGIGPSIGNVHSNRAPMETDESGTATAAPNPGRIRPQVTSNASGSMGGLGGAGGSAAGSPQSSVSPPQRMAPPLPIVPFGHSSDTLALNQIAASTMATSPSPPLSNASISLAAAVEDFAAAMGNNSSDLAMAKLPSATYDSSRKRGAASAPSSTLDNARGPTKFTKRTPPTEDYFPGSMNPSMASSMSPPPTISATPTAMPGPPPPAPPLLHAHTYPGLVTHQAGQAQNMQLAQATAAQAMYNQLSAAGSASSLTPVQVTPNPPHGYHTGPVATMPPGWPYESSSPSMGGVVIPPPHAGLERRFSSQDLAASFAQMNGFPDPNTNMMLPDTSLTHHSPPPSQAMSANEFATSMMQHFSQTSSMASGSRSGSANGLHPPSMMDLDGGMQSNGPSPASMSHLSDPSPNVHSPMDVTFSQSRPGTSHTRPSLPNGASSGVKTEPNSHSSPDGSEDEHDDDGDSDDGDEDCPPGMRGPSSNCGSVNGSRRSGAADGKRLKRRLGGGSDAHNPANLLSPELKNEVDRIFLEYLNKICSNLDATDAKGEAIHQTLMAKKMARLDESPDFRPFKFRIQAFTNGFVEELMRQGYHEEELPLKKTKAYLWHHNPYIARFNEDGKKAKSKGNHIWNIEAKKLSAGAAGDGQPRWIFKQFVRKIAGTPPGMAYIGLKWSWEPKIWDPQLSRASIDVEFSSPNMPNWMRWEAGALQGTPTPDSQTLDLIVEAKFAQDGQDKVLRVIHTVTVAPLAVGDSSYPKARRPSLQSSEGPTARRFVSDSVVQQTSGRMGALAPPPLPPPGPTAAETAQVIAVINSAANRVAHEVQTQTVSNPGPAQAHAQASLAKQQHVLAVTAQVISNEAHDALVGRSIGEQPKVASVLVQAAQAVVHQAARQLQADKNAVAILNSKNSPTQQPPVPPTPVSLTDVSIATQSAVAHAVAITGSQSSEVEVMLTANSLIQQRSRADSRSGLLPPASSYMR